MIRSSTSASIQSPMGIPTTEARIKRHALRISMCRQLVIRIASVMVLESIAVTGVATFSPNSMARSGMLNRASPNPKVARTVSEKRMTPTKRSVISSIGRFPLHARRVSGTFAESEFVIKSGFVTGGEKLDIEDIVLVTMLHDSIHDSFADPQPLIIGMDDYIENQGVNDAVANRAPRSYQSVIRVCEHRIPAIAKRAMQLHGRKAIFFIPAGCFEQGEQGIRIR